MTYPDVLLKGLKLAVKTSFPSALGNSLLQLFQLRLLTHLIRDLDVFTLGIEAEVPSHTFFRSTFETTIRGR